MPAKETTLAGNQRADLIGALPVRRGIAGQCRARTLVWRGIRRFRDRPLLSAMSGGGWDLRRFSLWSAPWGFRYWSDSNQASRTRHASPSAQIAARRLMSLWLASVVARVSPNSRRTCAPIFSLSSQVGPGRCQLLQRSLPLPQIAFRIDVQQLAFAESYLMSDQVAQIAVS